MKSKQASMPALVRRARSTVAAVVGVAMLTVSCSAIGGGRNRGGTEGAKSPGLVRELWRWTVPPPGSAGMPAVSPPPGQQVAFTYGHLGLVLLNHSGTERWRTTRVGLRDVAPLITRGSVLAATDEGVAAFDRDDGRVLWVIDIGERANTPVEVAGVAAVTTWDGSLVGLRVADGSVAWRRALPGASLGPAATDTATGAGEPMIVATWDAGRRAGATAVSAVDGRVVWDASLEPGGVSAPTIVGPGVGAALAPVVVVVAGDVAAHGLSVADGSEIWRTPLEGSGSPEVAPAPGVQGDVAIGHRLGGFAVMGLDGSLRWRASSDGVAVRGGPVAAAAAAVAMPLDDGRVLVGLDGQRRELRPADGRVSGLALLADGALVVATKGPQPAAVMALAGWASP